MHNPRRLRQAPALSSCNVKKMVTHQSLKKLNQRCATIKQQKKLVLADRTAARSMIGSWHDTVVCLSVCL